MHLVLHFNIQLVILCKSVFSLNSVNFRFFYMFFNILFWLLSLPSFLLLGES